MSAAAQRQLLSVTETAEFLSISKTTVRRLIASGRLRVYRPSPGRIVLKRDEVEQMLAASCSDQQRAVSCEVHA